MQTIELEDGGLLLYDEAFLPPDLAGRYFPELRDTAPWEQKQAAFSHSQPRLAASFGDDGVTYLYSGTENKALPWTPTLLEIMRGGETWPDAVMLRLHLKGLENFKVTNSEVTLEGSASLRDGKPLVRLWKDGKVDAPLDAKSPLWIEVRIVGGDGEQAKELPLKCGYFELPLPKAMFEGNPKSITVNWIDFYRN